jgi:hypothetical protein
MGRSGALGADRTAWGPPAHGAFYAATIYSLRRPPTVDELIAVRERMLAEPTLDFDDRVELLQLNDEALDRIAEALATDI